MNIFIKLTHQNPTHYWTPNRENYKYPLLHNFSHIKHVLFSLSSSQKFRPSLSFFFLISVFFFLHSIFFFPGPPLLPAPRSAVATPYVPPPFLGSCAFSCLSFCGYFFLTFYLMPNLYF